MHKFLVGLSAVAFALSSVGGAVAAPKKVAVPKATTAAKTKYKAKCKAPLKWNAVEAKCDKKVPKAKKAAKKAA